MPNFPIVDAHVHLIDPDRIPLRWGHEVPELNRPFNMTDFDRAKLKIDVEQIVFVEADVVAGRHLEEADMVDRLAQVDSRISAIVAHAPLELGEAAQNDIDRLAENPRVKGIRRLIQSESDPGWCINTRFVDGVRQLAARNLHFEICIRHQQAQAALELVRVCPNVAFILDHIGKPNIRDGELDPWRSHIKSMAELPNVVCKLSGLVTEADHASWKAEQIRPYIDHVIDSFGFDRVIFGSDWPVVTLASSYQQWVEALDQTLSGASRQELEKLYRDNARAFYRI